MPVPQPPINISSNLAIEISWDFPMISQEISRHKEYGMLQQRIELFIPVLKNGSSCILVCMYFTFLGVTRVQLESEFDSVLIPELYPSQQEPSGCSCHLVVDRCRNHDQGIILYFPTLVIDHFLPDVIIWYTASTVLVTVCNDDDHAPMPFYLMLFWIYFQLSSWTSSRK